MLKKPHFHQQNHRISLFFATLAQHQTTEEANKDAWLWLYFGRFERMPCLPFVTQECLKSITRRYPVYISMFSIVNKQFYKHTMTRKSWYEFICKLKFYFKVCQYVDANLMTWKTRMNCLCSARCMFTSLYLQILWYVQKCTAPFLYTVLHCAGLLLFCTLFRTWPFYTWRNRLEHGSL